MTPYLAIISARFRMLLQYRAAAIAGLFTQIFFGFVLIMVYEAFDRTSGRASPLPFAQVASYVWLGQALLAMQPWNVDQDLKQMIRSGAVVYELCKPIDLYALWYARAIALRSAPTMLRAVPMAVFAMLLLPQVIPEYALGPPASPAAGIAFAVAVAGAVALSAAITVAVTISLMWTVGGEGVVVIMSALVSILSGMIIPLPYMPDAVQEVIAWLPFAPLVDQPYRIYGGALPASAIALVLVRQLAWTLVFVAIGRAVLRRGVRILVAQGG
jgi:viologen exporter family transport system permease protein